MTDHLKSVRNLLDQARTHQTLHRTEQTLVGAIEGLLEWAELQAAGKLTGIVRITTPEEENEHRRRVGWPLIDTPEPLPQDNPGDRTEGQREPEDRHRDLAMRIIEAKEEEGNVTAAAQLIADGEAARISELEAQVVEREKTIESCRGELLKQSLEFASKAGGLSGEQLDAVIARTPETPAPSSPSPAAERALELVSNVYKLDPDPQPERTATWSRERRARCVECSGVTDENGVMRHSANCGAASPAAEDSTPDGDTPPSQGVVDRVAPSGGDSGRLLSPAAGLERALGFLHEAGGGVHVGRPRQHAKRVAPRPSDYVSGLPQADVPSLDAPYAFAHVQRVTCKACGNIADSEGYLEHSKSCFRLSKLGGGTSYHPEADLSAEPEAAAPSLPADANQQREQTAEERDGKAQAVAELARLCKNCGCAARMHSRSGEWCSTQKCGCPGFAEPEAAAPEQPWPSEHWEARRRDHLVSR